MPSASVGSWSLSRLYYSILLIVAILRSFAISQVSSRSAQKVLILLCRCAFSYSSWVRSNFLRSSAVLPSNWAPGANESLRMRRLASALMSWLVSLGSWTVLLYFFYMTGKLRLLFDKFTVLPGRKFCYPPAAAVLVVEAAPSFSERQPADTSSSSPIVIPTIPCSR